MIIGGIQKTTLIDYPKKVACTIFTSGCNFRCPFCYSQELILPEKIKEHPQISEEEILGFLKERKGLLDACVLCGGEPTIQRDLDVFCKKIKDLGFLIKLDTNGSNPSVIKDLLKKNLLDYIAMDVKTNLDEKKYQKASGSNIKIDKIKESVEMIKNSGVDYEFRTTVVPGIHGKEDIVQLAKDISFAKKYYIQNFLNEKPTINPKFLNINPFSKEFLEDIKDQISCYFEICQIR